MPCITKDRLTGMPSKQCFFQTNIFSYLLKDTMQVLKSYSQRWALILEKLRISFSFSTLKKSLRTLILIPNSQKIPWGHLFLILNSQENALEISFSILTLSTLTLTEVCSIVRYALKFNRRVKQLNLCKNGSRK